MLSKKLIYFNGGLVLKSIMDIRLREQACHVGRNWAYNFNELTYHNFIKLNSKFKQA